MFKCLYHYFLIRRSGLFDPAYYLLTYPDVRRVDMDPLMHFVKYGWKERRNPSQLFYTDFYLDNNEDVSESGINPVIHYLKHGGYKGRDPNPDFSSQYYLDTYPDVKSSGMNPIVHYVKFGQKEGRVTKSKDQISAMTDYLQSHLGDLNTSIDFFDVYTNIAETATTEIVDIVICVGNKHENFRDCLSTIRQFTEKDTYKLHIVTHQKDLQKLSDFISVDMQVHVHNMDLFNFSRANNLAIKQCKNDVVLLNDDTEVTEGWLKKLKKASKGVALTGARTDHLCSGNPQMWEEGPVIATHFPINMFCTYIPKRVRDVIGLLDEEFVYYGGDDVDYSIRALQNGFPLVISDAFVIHKDNQSYKGTKEALMIESDKVIDEKYGISSPFDLRPIMPIVSVIMATRNRPELVQHAIRSIENIEYNNFEIIVVDDNSDRNVNKILIKLQEEYKHIITIRLPNNSGLAGARAIGLQVAKGQFVLFTDDDDTVLPNRIVAPLKYILKNPNLDVVYCNYNIISNDGLSTPIFCQPFNHQAYLDLEFYIGSGILFGRRKAFIDVPFYSKYNRALDYDWVFRLIRMGYHIDLCPEIVMNYNRSGSVDQHLAGTEASKNQHQEIYKREVLLKKMGRKD